MDSLLVSVCCIVFGETTLKDVEAAGFKLMPNRTLKFPNHYRIIHPEGAAGFNEQNLRDLSGAFNDINIEP